MKTIILDSEEQKTYAVSLINESSEDGRKTVVIKNTDTSGTAKQRRLQWLWNTEVANSGLGRDDTKDGVHITAKWMFARPILLRDSEVFGAIYTGFAHMIEENPDQDRATQWREFTADYVSTEKMTKRQRAEYLTDFQRYWIGKGVSLTNPDDLGRNLLDK